MKKRPRPPRKKTPDDIETDVLMRCVRRCTLCFHEHGDLSKKLGQIAHLDRDRTNYAKNNLAFMCLEHHSLYDSRTSQHKNYKINEVKNARRRLYAAIVRGKHLVRSHEGKRSKVKGSRKTGTALTVQEPAKSAEASKPPTLLDLFKSDLPSTLKIAQEIHVQSQDGSAIDITAQLYVDFPARAKFVGLYIPKSTHTEGLCLHFAGAVSSTIEDLQKLVSVAGGYRGEQNKLEDLVFSGRVLLYHEEFLSITQKATIIAAFKAHGCDVNFRGLDYLGDRVVAWHHQKSNSKH